MCSNGSHEEILCMVGGKKDKGTSRPESNSMSQNLARMSARMDFSGIAQVPMAKLIAPIRRKLPAADREEKRDDDGRGRSEKNQAKGGFAHGAREPHPLHGDGLEHVHGDFAFDDLV